MKTRCSNPNAEDYKRYGAVGITYDPKWEKFEEFLSDMGERPEGTTLDRYPDGLGDYVPGNVRWATPREQAENRHTSIHHIDLDGELITLKEACRRMGVGYSAALARIRDGREWNDWRLGANQHSDDGITQPRSPRGK